MGCASSTSAEAAAAPDVDVLNIDDVDDDDDDLAGVLDALYDELDMEPTAVYRSPEVGEPPLSKCAFDMKLVSTLTKKGHHSHANQDSGLVCWPFNDTHEQALLCIFDGHGKESERVSSWAVGGDVGDNVDGIHSRLEARPAQLDADPSKCLIDTLIAMDRDLIRHPDLGGVAFAAGSTATVCYFRGERLHVACTGDSRAVLGRVDASGNLDAIDLTADHRPDLKEEKARIVKAGGKVTAASKSGGARVWANGEGGLAVSRSLGDARLKSHGVIPDPQVKELTLKPPKPGTSAAEHARAEGDHFVIVASDGVWEMVTSQQACACVLKHRSAKDATKALVKLAQAKWKRTKEGYRDDITCTVAMLPFYGGPSMVV